MPATINADNGVVSGSAGVKTTADTSGELALQSNGVTGLTLGTNLVTTLAQPLPVGSGGTGATSLSGITVGAATNATNATTATNIAGGGAGRVPYNTGAGATAFTTEGATGQLLQSNGTSAPTWVTPAPGAGTVTAVATGSISANATVVVNSDGTVSVVAKAVLTTPVFGPDSAFTSTSIDSPSAIYDPVNNRVVIAYRATNGFGTAVVGTVSGTSIVFGTPVVFASISIIATAITFDTANSKIVIMFTRGGNTANCVVGTVSGTTISFGARVDVNVGTASFPNIVYDSLNGKVVCAYQAGSPGAAIVGTVSGTTISFGTEVQFESSDTTVIAMTFDSGSNKVVIAYKDDNNSGRGTAIVGTVSGTSISFGTPVVFQASTTSFVAIAYNTLSNKVVIAYKPATGNGTAIVGTVSGTSISFGTAAVFFANEINQPKIVYDLSADRVLITYVDVNASSASMAIIGVVSGTSISFGTSAVFTSANSFPVSLAYEPQTEAVVMAYVSSAGSIGQAEICQIATTNMTSGNFIGFSQAAYTNGQTATVQTVGSSNNGQSALTPGRAYHVRKDGALGLLPTNPPVFAGTSLASTRILIKG